MFILSRKPSVNRGVAKGFQEKQILWVIKTRHLMIHFKCFSRYTLNHVNHFPVHPLTWANLCVFHILHHLENNKRANLAWYLTLLGLKPFVFESPTLQMTYRHSLFNSIQSVSDCIALVFLALTFTTLGQTLIYYWALNHVLDAWLMTLIKGRANEKLMEDVMVSVCWWISWSRVLGAS